MCLILVAWRSHPDFPLVVAANRDEYFARRTASADFWPDQPQLLAGRDLESGGTWMGITRTNRFAALTNYRDPAAVKPEAPSRGKLVADFLAGAEGIEAYLDRIEPEADRYNGFNLLLGDDSVHPDGLLPRTGVSVEWERLLSSAFVRAPDYGTRNSTVLRVDRLGEVAFDEQTWLEGGTAGPRAHHAFRLTGGIPPAEVL